MGQGLSPRRHSLDGVGAAVPWRSEDTEEERGVCMCVLTRVCTHACVCVLCVIIGVHVCSLVYVRTRVCFAFICVCGHM